MPKLRPRGWGVSQTKCEETAARRMEGATRARLGDKGEADKV